MAYGKGRLTGPTKGRYEPYFSRPSSLTHWLHTTTGTNVNMRIPIQFQFQLTIDNFGQDSFRLEIYIVRPEMGQGIKAVLELVHHPY